MFSTLLAFIIKGENQAKWRIGGLFMPNCQNLVLDSDPLFCYNFMAYPGIAEVVHRHIWDVEIVRSSRTTRTSSEIPATAPFSALPKTALWQEFLRFRPRFASLDSRPRRTGVRVFNG